MDRVYWRMKNGEYIDVDDMSKEHLRNTLKMIIRNSARQKSAPARDFVLNGECAEMFNNDQEINEMLDEMNPDGDMYGI